MTDVSPTITFFAELASAAAEKAINLGQYQAIASTTADPRFHQLASVLAEAKHAMTLAAERCATAAAVMGEIFGQGPRAPMLGPGLLEAMATEIERRSSVARRQAGDLDAPITVFSRLGRDDCQGISDELQQLREQWLAVERISSSVAAKISELSEK